MLTPPGTLKSDGVVSMRSLGMGWTGMVSASPRDDRGVLLAPDQCMIRRQRQNCPPVNRSLSPKRYPSRRAFASPITRPAKVRS